MIHFSKFFHFALIIFKMRPHYPASTEKKRYDLLSFRIELKHDANQHIFTVSPFAFCWNFKQKQSIKKSMAGWKK